MAEICIVKTEIRFFSVIIFKNAPELDSRIQILISFSELNSLLKFQLIKTMKPVINSESIHAS